MAAIQAVFFDLDDTLCDFQPAWRIAVQRSLSEIETRTGVPYDRLLETWQSGWQTLMAELGAYRLNMAEVRARRLPLLLETLSISHPGLADEVDLLLGREMLAELRLYEDVGVLGRLRPGCKTAIVTNGADDDHPDSQRSKALQLGVIEQVDGFFASDAYGRRKPDPAFLLSASESMGVNPDTVLFVGDSIDNDVIGANRAGMVSVLLWRSGEPLPNLEGDSMPHFVIRSLAEVDNLLLRADS